MPGIASVGQSVAGLPLHGIGGGRADLPIPFGLALAGAVLVLVVTFVAMAVLWPTSRLRGAAAGWPLPAGLSRALDSAAAHWLPRVAGLLITGYVLIAALGGPDDALNPTAGVVYVLFWVATLAFASAIFGPVWRALNPLRTIYLLACLVFRRDPRTGLLPYPPTLGYWPAAAGLGAFGWLELVAPNRATLPVLQAWFACYSLLMLVGAAVYGLHWFDRADGFEVASSLYGRLSVFGRRADRVLVVRNPLDGLAAVTPAPGLAATVSTLLGITLYDSISGSPFWVKWLQSSSIDRLISGSIGLVSVIALVWLLFCGACWLVAVAGGTDIARADLPGAFAHSIVPIAFGYIVAHYWSLLVLVGQTTVQQLSDPLGTGADWLGISGIGVSYAWVSASFVATLQVSAIVVGHVAAVVLAHDRGVALLPRRTALIGQLPLLVLMVGFTIGGLLLLFTA